MDEYPLLFQRMEKATIYYGLFTEHSRYTPCNIHVGTATQYQMLYYIDNDGTPMQIEPTNIRRVVFDKDSATYVPVEGKYFGQIVHEDSTGQIIKVWDLDREHITRDLRTTITGSNTRIDMKTMRWYEPNKSDKELPMQTTYYFRYDGQLFPITEKNILDHINPERKREYKAFTRSAEIISTNLSSVMKIWNTFFVNY